MTLTIGKKITLAYSLSMLFMAATGIVAYRSTARLLDANEWVEHTFLVIVSAEDIRADLLQFESACRGYLVDGDVRLYDSLEVLRTQMAESEKRIRSLTDDNLAQQGRLAVLERVIERRLADLMRISNTRKEKGLPAALLLVDQGKGLALRPEILKQLVEI